MRKIHWYPLVVLALSLIFFLASYRSPAQNIAPVVPEPIVIEQVSPSPVEGPRIKYQDRIVYQDRVVERFIVVKETTQVIKEPRWFNSVEELREWRSKRQATFFNGDCDDYAEWLMLDALQDGYFLPVVPVWHSAIFGEWVGNFGDRHMGNWT